MYCTLGIRSEPAAIHWAILTGTKDRPVLHASGTENSPKGYSEGESLAWIRVRLLDILQTYKPTRVAVRYPEGNARGANTNSAKARCRVEGVVLEAMGSWNLEVITGPMSTFAKHLGGGYSKEDLDSDGFRGLDWSKLKSAWRQEAIVIAASLLPNH